MISHHFIEPILNQNSYMLSIKKIYPKDEISLAFRVGIPTTFL